MTSRIARSTPRRLLGVWAHPDDETYLSAGLMARVIDAGGSVTVTSATAGELGFPEDDPRSSVERRSHREHELTAAMSPLGVSDVRVGDMADGSLDTTDPQYLAEWVRMTIEEVRPDCIVSFGPDGATGHPDHVAMSRATTRAWAQSDSAELLYATKTPAWYREFRSVNEEINLWMGDEPTGCPSEHVALQVDLDVGELNRKRFALSGHRSQTEGLADMMGEDTYRRWWASEWFRRPTVDDVARAVSPQAVAA